MNPRDSLEVLYREWRTLTNQEAEAIHANAWDLMSQRQTAKKMLQPKIVEAAGILANWPLRNMFQKADDDRYFRFTFVAENEEKFTYSFHLDDPAVNYFTHREILKLAMRSV